MPGRALIRPRRKLLSRAALAFATFVVATGVPAEPARAAQSVVSGVGIPVLFRLDQPGFVTLVIEDPKGHRIRNLIAETRLPAGENTVYWDGYHDGIRKSQGDLVRHRVLPGRYHLRGLAHDGITMCYEMSVDSGIPPWPTKDGSGGWLADHTPPADVLYLPKGVSPPNGKGRAHFLVGSSSGEAGSEFVWLEGEGRRVFGINDGFWGGTHLAHDLGANPAPDYYAYVFESGQRDADNFTLEVRGFRLDGNPLESVIKYPRPQSLKTLKGNEAYGSDGLAVYDGQLVFAVTMLNKLIFADARQKKVIGEADLASPRSPMFDRQGRLFVISEGKVKRYRIAAGRARLDGEQTLITEGLDDPRRLVVDDRGNLYVSDWAKSHQIKVFNAKGEHLRTIGKPGGPQIGPYVEERMAHPCGFAIDSRGWIWVAEGDFPKRISIWKTGGDFIKALYGPEKYGGGGALDPRDKTRFYYDEGGNGIEFALDWDTGTSKVKSVFWRPDLMPEFETMPAGPAPERAFYAGGHQYLVNSYNGVLRFNQDRDVGIWRMDADGIARPVAMIGNAADLVHPIWGWPMRNRDAIVKLWEDQKPENVLFVWCDHDGDHVAQPGEIQWAAEDHSSSPQHGIGGIGLEPLVHPDLSFTTAFGTRVPPPQFDPRGVPLYDLRQRIAVGDRQELRSQLIVGDWALTHEDSDGSWVGFDLRGGKRCRYPATPEEQIGGPGAMVAPTRLLGPAVTPRAGQAGPLVAINGEMGAIFLLTMDGLCIQTLGGDARLLPPVSERNPKRNWRLPDLTFQQEHFHPTLTQTADGAIYLVAGFQQGTLLRLEGWDEIHRWDFGELRVREQDLAGLPATSVKPSRKQGRPTLTVEIRSRGPQIDGDLADWPGHAQWIRVDDRATAAVTVDGQNLYVAYRTDDPRALENAGRDHRYIFKSGGALDLMLGTDPEARHDRHALAPGALRLLVARVEGRTTAVLYRGFAPDAPKTETVLFESPVGRVVFDQVRQVGGTVRLAQLGGNYEFSIPLRVLGLRPSVGMEILADVGILRGREGRTTQRAYWSNQDTTLVSDPPSEARLQPGNWGLWRFR
jgi:hypothetical protein